jgi:hypothetical protein
MVDDPVVRGLRGGAAAPHPTTADPVPGEVDPQVPLLFLHIPRTAGTTMKLALQSAFGFGRTLLDTHHYDRDGLDLDHYAVVEGHLLSTFFENSFGRAWFRNGFALLRDPVARTVSQARHIRAVARHREHDTLVPAVHDPAAVFDRVPNLSNLQTKMLAGALPRGRVPDDSHLEQAKALLDRMALGTTESFIESLTLMVERFALELPRFHSQNTSPADGDEDLRSDEFREVARQRNGLDVALHAHATSLLDERLRRYTEQLLALPLDSGELRWSVRSSAGRVEEAVLRPARARASPLRGWLTVDGHAPDAVLVRTSEGVVPLCCRIQSHAAVRTTRSIGARFAGVRGRVPLPEATSIELIALDRANGRRAERRFPVEVVTDRS